MEVGGRKFGLEELDEVDLNVEQKPGASTATVTGPGGVMRVELIDGLWRITALEPER